MDFVWDVHSLWQCKTLFSLCFFYLQKKQEYKVEVDVQLARAVLQGTIMWKIRLILFLANLLWIFFNLAPGNFHLSEKHSWKCPSPFMSLHLCFFNQDVWSLQFEAPGPTTSARRDGNSLFFLFFPSFGPQINTARSSAQWKHSIRIPSKSRAALYLSAALSHKCNQVFNRPWHRQALLFAHNALLLAAHKHVSSWQSSQLQVLTHYTHAQGGTSL